MGSGAIPERIQASIAADTAPGWTLTRALGGEDEACDRTLFALSDGWLGVRATPEECSDPAGGVFLSDAYERREIDYHERFPGFARSTDTRMPVADGKRVVVRLGTLSTDLAAGELLGGERRLDLASGRLSREAEWRSTEGARLRVGVERVACLRRPGLYPLRFTVTSIDYAGPVELAGIIDVSARAATKSDDPRIGVGADALPFLGWRDRGEVAIAVQSLPSRGLAVLCAQLVTAVAPVSAEADGARVIRGALRPGERLTLEKRVAYGMCDATPEAIEAAADALAGRLREAAGMSFEALAAEQASAWRDFWDAAEVDLDGAPELELGLRLNLFHLRQSADQTGRHGLAAKGLSGEGYEGHVFWDAEIFMLPVLIHTQPALARAHLQYRFRHLEGARRHAREMNFARGALYPWRTIGGDECSAYFPAGSAQLHINAAIAHAIGLYVEATQDQTFLTDCGAEMLFETARIWLEAGAFDARRDGAFVICGVTGPDEYTALVDNNYYTNLMAKAHLELAVAVAARLEADTPDFFATLAVRLDLTPAERETWARAAAAMRLPYDPVLGIDAQDDSFLDKPRFDLAGTAARRPLLLHFHPLTLYRHQVCKQADLVLGLVLEGRDVPLERKRRDYDYYEPLTAHDSTLSSTTFSVLAAEVNAPADALRFFSDTTLVDLNNRHDNTHHGAHMAAMAGSWLALSWGFAGLRTWNGLPSFRPTLPPGLTGYALRFAWRGATVRVEVGPTRAAYQLLHGPALDIEHEGERLTLSPGATVVRPWGANGPLEAVIFDLDGVLTDTAQAHYRAWKRLADEIGAPFSPQDNEHLKGVGRRESLDLLLGLAGMDLPLEQRARLADRKNGYYLAEIANLGPADLLPGARAALTQTRAAGLKTALASASRNAPQILRQLGICEFFDAIAEPVAERRSKPAPDLFLAAATALGVAPARCLGVEDSRAGVAAIRAAGMACIGVGDPLVLHEADLVIPDMTRFRAVRPGVQAPEPSAPALQKA